jgi:glycosyltransferase involved in cell wall biosynthesis
VPTAAIVSFRLGGTDGVSVEATKWEASLRRQGWGVVTVAGSGSADRLVPCLAIDSQEPPLASELDDAWAAADLVVVENVCSLPMNPAASAAVAVALAGRPALFHHHDLGWQRSRFADLDVAVVDDPAWHHVAINDLSRRQLRARGIEAVTIRNAFDTDAPHGDREATRDALGVKDGTLLALQPTRAIARKNIPMALTLAERLDATYWLLGMPEEGYGPELAGLLDDAGIPTIHGTGPTGAYDDVAQAYAAADLVLFPSSWEGFGNPVLESAIYRRPLAIGRYPIAGELAAFGFRWLPADDPATVARWMNDPDPGLVDHNLAVARRHFSLAALDAALAPVLDAAVTGRPAAKNTVPGRP